MEILNNPIFILVLELEGDYEDYYQRPEGPCFWSLDRSKLEEYWNSLPTVTEERGFMASRYTVEFRIHNDVKYIGYHIEMVPKLDM